MTSPVAPTFELSGGHLALDFVNTVGGMRGVRPNEHLSSYDDLLAFAVQTGSLSAEHARRIRSEATLRPAAAEAALAEAKELREALYRVFHARATGDAVPLADLALLNGALGRALAHRRLAAGQACCALGWDGEAALDAPWWPVLAAAADLLASPHELGRVRICAMAEEERCSWLFVDRTKAGTRRWCSMKDCGNRAKARRHYAKVKGGG